MIEKRAVTLREVRTLAKTTFGSVALVEECFNPHEFVVMVDGRVVARQSTLLKLWQALQANVTNLPLRAPIMKAAKRASL